MLRSGSHLDCFASLAMTKTQSHFAPAADHALAAAASIASASASTWNGFCKVGEPR